ncbi:POZ domain-containing protein [Schizopora paradoxa]|uniref:Elongin-C n=1 Tax=Schizopora paradoxa TaxID=27342 RepID=A0A0H2S245_9AGAM|nr:POZ domain-containing protein [Schizopora paradoxa]
MNNDVEMKNQEHSNEWVKIVSQDGFSFVIKRDVASQSGTLKSMIGTGEGFAEATSGVCNIPDYRGAVVEKLAEFMIYKKMYGHASPPEVIPDFQERIYPEIALELLMAADYLEL